MSIKGFPTKTESPSFPYNFVTAPLSGALISTFVLSVSI